VAQQALPVLQPHPSCTACDLATWPGLESPGLPTRVWDGGHTEPQPKKALLLVGSHPGVEENVKGSAFVGVTGQFTNRLYIKGGNLADFADVYLTNAVRCSPRTSELVTPKAVAACREWLDQDVRVLAQCYDEVVILATGENAISSVLQRKESLRTFHQGQVADVGGVECSVFATYLAAILLPSNDPSKILAIREHLLLVWRYLKFGYLPTTVKVPPPSELVGSRVLDPSPTTKLISLDVETYGAFERNHRGRLLPRQTVFHPAKSLHWDGVQRCDLVQTCALSWRSPRGGKLRTKVYRLDRRAECDRLVSVLQRLRQCCVLGQNVPFDVLYLRAFNHRFRRVLARPHCVLYELQVLNFLQNDQRAERSLKNLSLVLGVADYRDEAVDLKKGQRYRDSSDPRAWTYNAKDAQATLLDYEFLVEAISLWYGGDTDKWSSYSRQWYNEVLWLTVQMSENGVHYDVEQLGRVRAGRWLSSTLQ